MNFEHFSVLLKETVDGLDIKEDGIYVDGTLGGGGHSEEILSRLTTGKLIGIDQDENALKAASKRLERFGTVFIPVRSNFSDILNVLKKLGIEKIDGMMMDLGVSSHQLDEADRGFSYRFDAPLDMRMDQRSDFDAYQVVNTYSEDELNRILRDYGEEKWARRIAKFICEKRAEKPIETTQELVDLVYSAIPTGARREGGHPAKRTFQAIRIEVNGELEIIKQTIEDITSVLNKNGRISIITFHSLEDRLVKQTYKALATGCICPPELPVCVCNNKPKLKIITRKPILPSKEELEVNSRSKSAKLRVAKRYSFGGSMEAAKKIYENSYNDRLEAAVSAKAYLDHMDNERKISEVVINKRKNTGRLCNVIGIVSSIAYCALVLCILLYPLVKETELHRLNAAFSDYKNELRALDKNIEDARAVLSDQTVISHIEKVATEELGLIRRSTGNKIEIQTDEYFTLEEARENYYNKTYHKALQGNIE